MRLSMQAALCGTSSSAACAQIEREPRVVKWRRLNQDDGQRLSAALGAVEEDATMGVSRRRRRE